MTPVCCASCGGSMNIPFASATVGGLELHACSELCLEEAVAVERARAECALCSAETPSDDRLPFMTEVGGQPVRRVVHAGCVGRLQNAIGFERASMLLRKSGPGFRS